MPSVQVVGPAGLPPVDSEHFETMARAAQRRKEACSKAEDLRSHRLVGRCLTVDGRSDEVQLGVSTVSREAGQGLQVPFVRFKPGGSQRGELGRFDPSSLGVDALAVRRKVGSCGPLFLWAPPSVRCWFGDSATCCSCDS